MESLAGASPCHLEGVTCLRLGFGSHFLSQMPHSSKPAILQTGVEQGTHRYITLDVTDSECCCVVIMILNGLAL